MNFFISSSVSIPRDSRSFRVSGWSEEISDMRQYYHTKGVSYIIKGYYSLTSLLCYFLEKANRKASLRKNSFLSRGNYVMEITSSQKHRQINSWRASGDIWMPRICSTPSGNKCLRVKLLNSINSLKLINSSISLPIKKQKQKHFLKNILTSISIDRSSNHTP